MLRVGSQVELRSPDFVFTLDTAAGLRGVSLVNRRTGHTIALDGPELDVDLGMPGAPLARPAWTATLETPTKSEGAEGECAFHLVSKEPPLEATVTYRWDSKQPVLRKLARVRNPTQKEVRLLNVRLGTYKTAAKIAEREQGFPIYLDDEAFLSLAHPAGWATGKDGIAELRHYPGAKLAPGASHDCMEAVYGVGAAGAARASFVAHVRSRMRRVVRGHDHPYAIFDNFGSWPSGDFMNSEADELHSLARLAESQRATGCRFDICNIHFWVDSTGDLKRFDPARFPNGITTIRAALASLGIAPGLWIDSSTTWGGWGIGQSAAAQPSLSDNPTIFCRASEPIRSMFRDAFIHHIRENGVREIKFDNLNVVCNNSRHDHLPGPYSTEAIEDSIVGFLRDLDRECPEVFLILYWGHRSPWWLLHGDTLFDSGIGIEAASPSSQPSPFARDSVTQKLDQAQWHSSDVPPLGKDSLGVWLSSWGWNSSIGKDRWQEGLVMDLCRGSLLAQIWADRDWLSPPEWRQLADFIALLRARPACFGNPRFILGNPWNDEAYGYCCGDGKRAMIALDNCTWGDRRVTLELGPAWGLAESKRWDLYRWYPDPARLTEDGTGNSARPSIALRPFEVVLLEAVPAGGAPALDRQLSTRPIPTQFSEPSRDLDVAVRDANPRDDPAIWTVLEPESARSEKGATLTIESDHSIAASGACPSPDRYVVNIDTKIAGITAFRLEAMEDPRLPARGPGRAFNGNFALRELSVALATRLGSESAEVYVTDAPLALRNPAASYSQLSYGGWPVAAAIDGDPKTAWSIDPREGEMQAAVFETREPLGAGAPTRLVVTLDQGYASGPADHTLGRFRLLATTAKPPIPAPVSTASRRVVATATAPASPRGGMLMFTAQLENGGGPAWLPDIGTHFSAEAKIGGAAAECRAVLGNATYPSCWQAWRIPVAAAAEPRPLELEVAASLPPGVRWVFKGHYIPAP